MLAKWPLSWLVIGNRHSPGAVVERIAPTPLLLIHGTADRLVPCEMARYSLEGFADLMETIDTVKGEGSFSTQKFVRILLTKYDSRKTISIEWVMDQLAPFKGLLFRTKIRQNEALNQAHMAMEPIFMFKPNSFGAEDYGKMTKEFLSLCRRLERS